MDLEFHVDPPFNGVQNMNIDEEIFHRFNDSGHPSHKFKEDFCSVRVYEWSDPILSVGFTQKNKDIFNDRLYEENLEVVPRTTGGRVVLHHREITYSVVGSVNGFFGSTLHPTYDRISAILKKFLIKIGLKPNSISSSSVTRKKGKFFREGSLVCYDSMGFKEITIHGKKLIGSAQKRGRYAFLQHGSIPYYRHNFRVENYLREEYLPSHPWKNDYIFLSDYIDTSILPIGKAKSILLNVFRQELGGKELLDISFNDNKNSLVRTL